MPTQEQQLGAGAIGLQLSGDNNRISINSVRDKLRIPAYLPYALNRDPQIDQVQLALANRSRKPLCLVCLCDHEDAAETFAMRVRRHLLDTENLLSASVEFDQAKTADELTARWVRRLQITLCSTATGAPSATVPTDAAWDGVLAHIDSIQHCDVFISTVVERESIINMPARVWQGWRDEVASRFSTIRNPKRVVLFLAIVRRQRGLLGSLLWRRPEKLVQQLLLPHDSLESQRLGEFELIDKDHCFDWAALYLAPWYRENVSRGDAGAAQDEVDLIKAEITGAFGDSESLPLRPLGQSIEEIIRRKIDS